MGMWTTNFILKQFDNFIDTKCIVAAKLVKVRKQQLRGLVFKMENPFCINIRNKIFTFFPTLVAYLELDLVIASIEIVRIML